MFCRSGLAKFKLAFEKMFRKRFDINHIHNDARKELLGCIAITYLEQEEEVFSKSARKVKSVSL
jgi:hypothetical protein